MTSAFSWQNSISLCPASFCTSRPNLPVTPGVSWLPTFAFQSPIMKRTSFWVLVLKGLVGLHRTIQLQLLQHYCLGHRLGLRWYWMVCLGNEQRSFCHFWDCIQVLHFGLFCSKFSKPGFSNTWTMNFEMFKLVLEKAEEPEIKSPTSAGSWKNQESSRKTSISAFLTMPQPLTVWITINGGKFWKRWEYQTTWPASWETYMQVRKQQLELDMEQQTDSK